jgi:Ca2+-binding RTX toxin-like protein
LLRRSAARLSTIALLLTATGTALTATSPAHADTPICDGKPATIVGPGPGNVIEGTPGDDVVVTVAEVANGPDGAINTYGGNDTVCVIPGTAAAVDQDDLLAFFVRTGPGDDKVFIQEPRNTSDLVIHLGLGADTFLGNDRTERVSAGQPKIYPDGPWWHMPDDAQDVIDTAGGLDWIYTGTPGAINTDIISSGPGRDEITQAGVGTTIDNGDVPGEGDRLTILGHEWKQSLFTIDNRTRTATGDNGEVMRWTNVDVFHVMAESPLRYVGADTRDILYLDSSLNPHERSAVPVDVSLNGGDDYFSFANGIASGRVDGGDGADSFQPENGDPCLVVAATLNQAYTCTVDIARIPGVPTPPGPAPTYQVALDGFETYFYFDANRSASIVGTNGDDTIRVYAPSVNVRGLRGDDHLYSPAHDSRAVLRGDQGRDRLFGFDGRDRLLGGKGRDKMHGGQGRDTLRGGTGYDKAKGNTGRDTCRAEVERSCER